MHVWPPHLKDGELSASGKRSRRSRGRRGVGTWLRSSPQPFPEDHFPGQTT